MNAPARDNQNGLMSQVAVWFGLLGGAVAWIVHLFAAYAMVPFACARGLESALYGVSILTALVALSATGVAGYRWWSTRGVDRDVNGRSQSMALAVLGILLSGLFFAVILAQSMPIVLGDPCDPAGSLRF